MRACYACGLKFSGIGWRYKGTGFTLCPTCHETTKRKEERDPVGVPPRAPVGGRPPALRTGRESRQWESNRIGKDAE
jgi:hypothetical protein